MEFRKSTEADIDEIMKIINQAQQYLKGQNIDQWQNNYPNIQVIKQDILDESSYVLTEGDLIIGTVCISFDGERTYDKIYEGQWKSNQDYAVIHRIAIRDEYKGRGYSGYIIKKAEEMCLKRNVHSIRVDTHKDNISMQKLLAKQGFEYCGLIYLGDGSPRIAFEKLV